MLTYDPALSRNRPPIAALMRGDALATVEYLDHPGGGTDIDLLADEAVRDGIEEALELDVIIRRDPRQAPFGELVVLCGKGCEGWAFDRLEEMPAADAEPAHDMIVDAREHLGDRGIGLGKREEGLLAQAAENAALGKAHGVLDLGLIWHDHADASISLPHFGGRRYGETIRDVGRREHASAGRPSERHGLRARAFIWSPLRLTRMRCERGSVVAV